MSKLVTVVLVLCAVAAAGCEDKKGDAKPAASGAANAPAKTTAAPAKSAAPAGGGW